MDTPTETQAPKARTLDQSRPSCFICGAVLSPTDTETGSLKCSVCQQQANR